MSVKFAKIFLLISLSVTVAHGQMIIKDSDNNEFARVTAQGQVLIGTSSPFSSNAQMEVKGSNATLRLVPLQNHEHLLLDTYETGASKRSRAALKAVPIPGDTDDAGGTLHIQVVDDDGTGWDHGITVKGSSTFYNTASVGIGLSNPGSDVSLNILADSRHSIRFTSPEPQGANASIYGGNNDLYIYTNEGKRLGFGSEATYQDMTIYKHYVGIGTTNPQARLHVNRSGLADVKYPRVGSNYIGGLFNPLLASNNEVPLVACYGATRRADAGLIRVGVHGSLWRSDDSDWIAGGNLGVQNLHEGNVTTFIGVEGAVNNVTGLLPGQARIAGRFSNDSRTAYDWALQCTGIVEFTGSDNARVRFSNQVASGTTWTNGTINLGANDDHVAIFRLGSELHLGNINPQGPIIFTATNQNYKFVNILPGDGSDIRVSGDGVLLRATSSTLHNDAIAPMEEDYSKILSVEPKTFRYKQTLQPSFGYIAEELESIGLNKLVIYNSQGQPDAVAYDKVALYLVEVVKGLKQEVEYLKVIVNSLK